MITLNLTADREGINILKRTVRANGGSKRFASWCVNFRPDHGEIVEIELPNNKGVIRVCWFRDHKCDTFYMTY